MDEIASETGVGRARITLRLALFSLVPEYRDAYGRGELKPTHANHLARLSPPYQRVLFSAITSGRCNTRVELRAVAKELVHAERANDGMLPALSAPALDSQTTTNVCPKKRATNAQAVVAAAPASAKRARQRKPQRKAGHPKPDLYDPEMESPDMMPKTIHGHGALLCISMLQKYIRRGMEREAMLVACELIHTRKQYHTMVCNRLEVISHEDIDTSADPTIVLFVRAAVEQSKAWYDPNRIGRCRMPLGNAIRLMCRAKKSRMGDHFHAAVGLANLLENEFPEIPDWAKDQHTSEGRRLGRGLEHFRTEGTKLVPPPTEPDPYEDEAFRLWAKKRELEAKEKEGEGPPAPRPGKTRELSGAVAVAQGEQRALFGANTDDE